MASAVSDFVLMGEDQAFTSRLARRLRARDAVERDAWQAVVRSQSDAVRESTKLRDERSKMEAEIARLTRANQRLIHRARPGTGGSDTVSDSPLAEDLSESMLLGLDAGANAEADRLQEELKGAYMRNSELAQRILEMTNGIRSLEDELGERDDVIADRNAALKQAQVTQKSLESDIHDGEIATQLLQGELRALQGEMKSKTEENTRLVAENEILITRMLAKAQEEASKLNEINAMFDEVSSRAEVAARERRVEVATASQDADVGKRMSLLDRLGGAFGQSSVGAIVPTKGARLIEAHQGECNHIAFSPSSGATIATAGADRVVKLWDTRQCQTSSRPTAKLSLKGHTQGVYCVDFTAHDELLVSASADNTVRVWDARDGRCKHTLTGHIGKVMSAHFSAGDNSKVLSGSHDRSLKVWDLTKGYCTKTIFCYSSCNSVAFSDDGRTAVSGHFDNSVRLWDTKSGDASVEITDAHTAQVTSVCFHPTEDAYVLSNSRDHSLALIDTRTQKVVRKFVHDAFRNGSNWSNAVFSGDGRFVCAGGSEGGLFVWDTNTGAIKTPGGKPIKLGATEQVQATSVTCVSWSSDGSPVAGADKNGNIRIYE